MQEALRRDFRPGRRFFAVPFCISFILRNVAQVYQMFCILNLLVCPCQNWNVGLAVLFFLCTLKIEEDIKRRAEHKQDNWCICGQHCADAIK